VQVHDQQQHYGQGQQGGHDELGRGAEVLVVDVVPRGATRRAPAFDHRSGTLSTDQVFTAHRNPFRLARAPALAAMLRPKLPVSL
jgi:hypothetical protein